MEKTYFIFYKGVGLGAMLIRWWTKSRVNHCEVWNGHQLIGVPSNSKEVRILNQDYLNPKKWEVYEILNNDFWKTLNDFYYTTKGLKYDNKAILFSNFFNRGEQDKDKYTCSEWCIELLDKYYKFIYPKWYSKFSPQDILEVLIEKKIARKVELNENGKIEKE